MPDNISSPQPDLSSFPAGAETAGSTFEPRELPVFPAPPSRERPVANLGKIFGQFAELQEQIAEQVVALEDSVSQQRQDLTHAISQLPEIRERINWLIASFYEQSKKEESLKEKLSRHDATLTALIEAVKSIHEAQTQWQAAVEDMIGGLMRARTAAVPPLPQL